MTMKKRIRILSLFWLGLALTFVTIVDFQPLLAEKSGKIYDNDVVRIDLGLERTTTQGESWLEKFEDADPNSVLAIRSARWDYTGLALYTDQGIVTLDWSAGVLDLKGDKSAYSKAAETFLTTVCTDAAYRVAANDPEMIRRLAKEGCICKVLGHAWEDTTNAVLVEQHINLVPDYQPAGWEHRTCSICGTTETRKLTEWK